MIMYCVRDPCVIRKLVRIILKVFDLFYFLFITGLLVLIILFSRNRDSKFAQSRAMKMLSRQALFLLLHAAKLVATGRLTSTVPAAWPGAAQL